MMRLETIVNDEGSVCMSANMCKLMLEFAEHKSANTHRTNDGQLYLRILHGLSGALR